MTLLLVLACSSRTAPGGGPGGGVVVARTDIDPGTALTEDRFVLADVPGWGEGLLTDLAEVRGRFAAAPLLAGEPVRAGRLTDRAVPAGREPVRLAGGPVGALHPGDPVELVRLGGPPAVAAEQVPVLSVHADGITVSAPAGFDANGPWAWSMVSPRDVSGAREHGPLVPLEVPPGAGWVAARDLQPGLRVTRDDVVPWALPTAFPSLGDDVLDRLPLATPVLAGEPLRRARFGMPEHRPAALVPRGMRGVTLHHDRAPSLRGGNFVDIVTVRDGHAALTHQAQFVLGAPDPSTTTVLVTPDDALVLLRDSADPDVRLVLAVRNDRDLTFLDLEGSAP